MSAAQARLILALREPSITLRCSAAEWSALIRTARSANLLGALAERLDYAGAACPNPEAARHLLGARQLSQRQRQSVRWEAHELRRALAPLGVAVTLLKGAAYALADLPISHGRLFGDIDILVPREELGRIEMQLMLKGWISAKTDPYDQEYYRKWMHELPPMTHVRRGTVLDIHHSILPLTALRRPDPTAILERAGVLEGFAPFRIPSPEDLAIHCITHFMHEGEMDNGLRDLHDIDGLLRHFGVRAGFWERLVKYAIGHDLAVPVAQGLALSSSVFSTPVPAAVVASLQHHDSKAALSPVLNWAYANALTPEQPTAFGQSWLARQLLYVRAHALRMPVGQLIRHLSRKMLMRRQARISQSPPDPADDRVG